MRFSGPLHVNCPQTHSTVGPRASIIVQTSISMSRHFTRAPLACPIYLLLFPSYIHTLAEVGPCWSPNTHHSANLLTRAITTLQNALPAFFVLENSSNLAKPAQMSSFLRMKPSFPDHPRKSLALAVLEIPPITPLCHSPAFA